MTKLGLEVLFELLAHCRGFSRGIGLYFRLTEGRSKKLQRLFKPYIEAMVSGLIT